jgi:Na+(H+)/acetate symporter ActP
MVPTILLALYWHEITLTAALLGILAVTFLHGVVGLLSNIAARQN